MIKKAFFDGWDNLIAIILMNVCYTLLFVCGIYVLGLGSVHYLIGYGALALVWLLTCLCLGGTANVVKSYSDYGKDTWSMFKEGFARNARHSLFFWMITSLMFIVIIFVMPFYLMMSNAFGFIVALVLFWVLFFLFLSLPFYFALMETLPGDRPFKTFKKCFIITLGNPGLTFFYLVYNLVNIAISIFSMGLIPGMVGLQLAAQDAVKLLMFKYDYLEENPDANPKKINWDDLLFEEREKIGPRSLRSMIFPWKE